MKKLRISAFPEEVQLELEIQAEAAGMTVAEYAAELLHEALQGMLEPEAGDGQAPVLH